MTEPKYEAELTRAAERLQAAMGDYMGVGLLCVDAAIERVVQERDELRAALAEAEAEIGRLKRPFTANPPSLNVEEISSMYKWLDKSAWRAHGSDPEYRQSMVAIQHIAELTAEVARLTAEVTRLTEKGK